jgi:hypothetical protein
VDFLIVDADYQLEDADQALFVAGDYCEVLEEGLEGGRREEEGAELEGEGWAGAGRIGSFVRGSWLIISGSGLKGGAAILGSAWCGMGEVV